MLRKALFALAAFAAMAFGAAGKATADHGCYGPGYGGGYGGHHGGYHGGGYYGGGYGGGRYYSGYRGGVLRQSARVLLAITRRTAATDIRAAIGGSGFSISIGF